MSTPIVLSIYLSCYAFFRAKAEKAIIKRFYSKNFQVWGPEVTFSISNFVFSNLKSCHVVVKLQAFKIL